MREEKTYIYSSTNMCIRQGIPPPKKTKQQCQSNFIRLLSIVCTLNLTKHSTSSLLHDLKRIFRCSKHSWKSCNLHKKQTHTK